LVLVWFGGVERVFSPLKFCGRFMRFLQEKALSHHLTVALSVVIGGLFH
jgi:hypothetical protein